MGTLPGLLYVANTPSGEHSRAGMRRMKMTTQKPSKQDDTPPAGGLPPLNTQLDPDYFYTIFDGTTVVAQIVATGTVAVTVVGSTTQPTRINTEFWYVNAEALAVLADASEKTLRIQADALGASVTLDSSVAYAFASNEGATWTSSLPAPTTGINRIYSGAPTAPAGATAAYLLLNIKQAIPSGPYGLAAVQWYLTGLSTSPSSTGGVLNPGDGTGVRYPAASTLPTTYWAAASL